MHFPHCPIYFLIREPNAVQCAAVLEYWIIELFVQVIKDIFRRLQSKVTVWNFQYARVYEKIVRVSKIPVRVYYRTRNSLAVRWTFPLEQEPIRRPWSHQNTDILWRGKPVTGAVRWHGQTNRHLRVAPTVPHAHIYVACVKPTLSASTFTHQTTLFERKLRRVSTLVGARLQGVI